MLNLLKISISGKTNPVVISVEALKSNFNSSSKTFRSQWTSGEYADVYYDDGLYMKKNGSNTPNCTVYGIK